MGAVITVKDRESSRLLRRSSSRNSRVWLSRTPFVPRLFTSFQPGLEEWRVAGVGNCFEHLTESVGKFWPALRIRPYLRAADERRSYESRTRVNTVSSIVPPKTRRAFPRGRQGARKIARHAVGAYNTCPARGKVWRRTIFHSQTQEPARTGRVREFLELASRNDQVRLSERGAHTW